MRNPGPLVGWILMIAAIAGTVVLGTLPAPYVIESPGPVFDTITDSFLPYAKADPDLEMLRNEPRYLAMVAAAEARLAGAAAAAS